ncbi:MAG: FHA domain-containing protein [Acidimicrobiales bacterium]
MPTSLLQILNDCLLALLLLFLLRVLRAVWVQLNPAPTVVAPVAAPAKRSGLRLKVVEPPARRGETFDLGDEITLGRSPGCGVSLQDSTVSQVHARLFRQGSRLWIEDLGSTNGTWVNRNKVSAPVALKRGDRVSVGGTVLEVAR